MAASAAVAAANEPESSDWQYNLPAVHGLGRRLGRDLAQVLSAVTDIKGQDRIMTTSGRMPAGPGNLRGVLDTDVGVVGCGVTAGTGGSGRARATGVE